MFDEGERWSITHRERSIQLRASISFKPHEGESISRARAFGNASISSTSFTAWVVTEKITSPDCSGLLAKSSSGSSAANGDDLFYQTTLSRRIETIRSNSSRLMIDPDGKVCIGIGWVCENHNHRAWSQ
jgi:hypothetical protein